MYPIPPGTLPVTGVNLLGFALAGAILTILGLAAARLAYFARRRRSRRGTVTKQGRPR